MCGVVCEGDIMSKTAEFRDSDSPSPFHHVRPRQRVRLVPQSLSQLFGQPLSILGTAAINLAKHATRLNGLPIIHKATQCP